MSDSSNDARKDRADVSGYAPRHHRATPDETTILPVLERLSRGQSDGASQARSVDPAPAAEPIRERHTLSSPRLPLLATGRLAVAVGLVVAVTAVSAAVMRSRAAHPTATDTAAPGIKRALAKDQAKVPATDMPRPVHTVTIRPQAAELQPTPVEDTQPAAHADTVQPLMAPLKTWAMFPDTATAQASGSAATDGAKVEDAKNIEATKQSEPAKTSEPAKEVVRKPAHVRHKARARRTARRTRRHHRVRRRHVRTAAKPQPVQQAQGATPTQPVKKMPIQAAIDSIFSGGGSSSGASGGGNSAPMTTGAAFQ